MLQVANDTDETFLVFFLKGNHTKRRNLLLCPVYNETGKSVSPLARRHVQPEQFSGFRQVLMRSSNRTGRGLTVGNRHFSPLEF